MRKKVLGKSIIALLSMTMMFSLTSCGHKKASKGADSVRKQQKEIKWDQGELSERHKKQSRTVTDLFVKKVDNMTENVIKGMDVSSLLVEEAAGVVYHDENGKEADMLKIIADAGHVFVFGTILRIKMEIIMVVVIMTLMPVWKLVKEQLLII